MKGGKELIQQVTGAAFLLIEKATYHTQDLFKNLQPITLKICSRIFNQNDITAC